MPGSNVDFWKRKFRENVTRDRRTRRELERLGWRVLAVWECELAGDTVGTIERVASWLREGLEAQRELDAEKPVLDRGELLAVAEDKVRYRIASYGEGQELRFSGVSQVRK